MNDDLFSVHKTLSCLEFNQYSICNAKILSRAIKRRRANTNALTNNNGGASATSPTPDSEENRQALVLFFIVVLFLVCNIPRIILNAYEMLQVHTIRANRDNKCFALPGWILLTTNLSLVLITLNSSVNFFIYCLVNTTFRKEMLTRLSAVDALVLGPLRARRTTNGAAQVPNGAGGARRPTVVVTTGEGGNGNAISLQEPMIKAEAPANGAAKSQAQDV